MDEEKRLKQKVQPENQQKKKFIEWMDNLTTEEKHFIVFDFLFNQKHFLIRKKKDTFMDG